MAVVEPLASYDSESQIDRSPVDVIRLVDRLGPISPELVLVDPQLAAHARALLPDRRITQSFTRRDPLPDVRVTKPLERREPAASVPSSAIPARRRRSIPWRFVAAGAVVAALATTGFNVWTTFAGTNANPPQQPSAETESTFFTTPPTEPDVSPDEIAALETAVRRDPRSPIAREALGAAYFRLRRWTDAESEFRALVGLTPSDDFAHFALGRALASQGRQREAALELELAGSLSEGEK